MTPDPHIKKKWMGLLAKLVSPAFPTDAADALLAMLPFLDDIPPEAFTRRSMEAVVAAKRRQAIPSLDELRVPLLAWWQDHQRHIPRLAGPGPSLSTMDWAWMRYWQAREQEGFCAYGNGPGGRRHVASLIRQQSPAAWAQIRAEASHVENPAYGEATGRSGDDLVSR
jgi:hypothetical protein